MSLRSAGLQFAVAMACSSAESAPAGLSRGAPNARGRLRTPPRTGLFQTGTWGFRSNLGERPRTLPRPFPIISGNTDSGSIVSLRAAEGTG